MGLMDKLKGLVGRQQEAGRQRASTLPRTRGRRTRADHKADAQIDTAADEAKDVVDKLDDLGVAFGQREPPIASGVDVPPHHRCAAVRRPR